MKALDSLDVDERPPPIVKLVVVVVEHRAKLFSTFWMDNPLDFKPAYVMKLQAISEKLNKISPYDLKTQHQWTMDSFFKFIFVKTFERTFVLYKWQCVFSGSTSLL
jgi:hypothetical protein